MTSEASLYGQVNAEAGTSQSPQYGFKVNRIYMVRHLMSETCESLWILFGKDFQDTRQLNGAAYPEIPHVKRMLCIVLLHCSQPICIGHMTSGVFRNGGLHPCTAATILGPGSPGSGNLRRNSESLANPSRERRVSSNPLSKTNCAEPRHRVPLGLSSESG